MPLPPVPAEAHGPPPQGVVNPPGATDTVVYTIDAVEEFKSVRGAVWAGHTANTASMYTSAVHSLLQPFGGRPLSHLTADEIDRVVWFFVHTRSSYRARQAISGWAAFRKWLLAAKNIALPPGRHLTERWRRTTEPQLQPRLPAVVTVEDHEDLAVLRRATPEIKLVTICAMRWEGMTKSSIGGVDVPLFTGGTILLPVAAATKLTERWIRLGRPETGWVFPRTPTGPGRDLPVPYVTVQEMVDRIKAAEAHMARSGLE